MKVKKAIVLPALAALVITGTALVGTNSVSAQSGSDTLVEKIAGKFNLDKSEVQSVFDEAKEERRAEQQTKLSENLQEKVDDGTITLEQKALLENKLNEMHEQRKDSKNQDLSKEERRQQRKQHRDEFKKWAEENNIPIEVLGNLGVGPGHGGRQHFRQQ